MIYHIGDCGNYTQLHPTKSVDIFIPHCAVGLNMKKAVNERVKPKMVLMSHVLMMEYPATGSYRWPYSRGISESLKVDPDNKFSFVPVWGERIDYAK